METTYPPTVADPNERMREMATIAHDKLSALPDEWTRELLHRLITDAMDYQSAAAAGRWFDGRVLSEEETRMLRTIGNATMHQFFHFTRNFA